MSKNPKTYNKQISSTLSNGKAPEKDTFKTEAMKHLPLQISPMFHLVNYIFETGVFLDVLKKCNHRSNL